MSTKVTQGTTDDPCECCAPPCIVTSLSCRTRGGIAELCGHDEIGTPSSPPKKYLTCTFGGSIHGDAYFFQGTSCTTIGGFFDITWTGAADYDADTCDLAPGLQTLTENGGAPIYSDLNGPVIGTTDCGDTWTITSTTGSTTGTGACCATAININQIHAGTRNWALSNEDTDANAKDRLLAGPDGEWGPYSGAPTCGAAWQIRTTGFTFEYIEAEFKVVASGLTPNRNYKTYVDIFRRLYGVGSYTLFQTMEITEKTDSSGNLEAGPFDVPNEEGYQTYAAPADCP